MRRTLLPLVALCALLVGACGDDDAIDVGDGTTTSVTDPTTTTSDSDDTTTTSTTEPEPPRPAFTGRFEVDHETGEVVIDEYAAFLAEHGPPDGGAESAALELLDPVYGSDAEPMPEPDVTSEAADGGRTVVTVVYDGLPDDSVAAERYELVFVGEGDALILESGSWASRCQPDRGHQEFGIGLCL